jgi:hypothetical protein
LGDAFDVSPLATADAHSLRAYTAVASVLCAVVIALLLVRLMRPLRSSRSWFPLQLRYTAGTEFPRKNSIFQHAAQSERTCLG